MYAGLLGLLILFAIPHYCFQPPHRDWGLNTSSFISEYSASDLTTTRYNYLHRTMINHITMSSPNSKAWTRESGTSTHLRDSPYQQPSMDYRSETASGDQVTPQSARPRRPRRHHRSPSVANTFPAQSDRAGRPSRNDRHHQDYPNDTAAIAPNEEIITRARSKRPSTRNHRARSLGGPSSPARVSNPRTSSRNATHYREPTNGTGKVPSTERAPNSRPSRSARAETRLSGGGHHKDRSGDSCFSACCIISSALCGCGGGGDGGGGGGE